MFFFPMSEVEEDKKDVLSVSLFSYQIVHPNSCSFTQLSKSSVRLLSIFTTGKYLATDSCCNRLSAQWRQRPNVCVPLSHRKRYSTSILHKNKNITYKIKQKCNMLFRLRYSNTLYFFGSFPTISVFFSSYYKNKIKFALCLRSIIWYLTTKVTS